MSPRRYLEQSFVSLSGNQSSETEHGTAILPNALSLEIETFGDSKTHAVFRGHAFLVTTSTISIEGSQSRSCCVS